MDKRQYIVADDPIAEKLEQEIKTKKDTNAIRIQRLLSLPDLSRKENSPIKFIIDKNNKDSEIYDILAGQLDKNLKEKAKFSFNPKNYEVILEFKEPTTIEKNTKYWC